MKNWLSMSRSDFDTDVDPTLFEAVKAAPDPDECGTVDILELLVDEEGDR